VVDPHNPTTLLRLVDLGILDDDHVGGKVNAPCERGRAHEHLHSVVGEQFFGDTAVFARHTGVMDGKTEGEETA
jgi:hypothetical protein